jgi:hypothetical protein
MSAQPFFALSAAELNTALPLLTEVSPDILKVVFPLLAQQPEGTMDKMLKFLSLVSSSSSSSSGDNSIGDSSNSGGGSSLRDYGHNAQAPVSGQHQQQQ